MNINDNNKPRGKGRPTKGNKALAIDKSVTDIKPIGEDIKNIMNDIKPELTPEVVSSIMDDEKIELEPMIDQAFDSEFSVPVIDKVDAFSSSTDASESELSTSSDATNPIKPEPTPPDEFKFEAEPSPSFESKSDEDSNSEILDPEENDKAYRETAKVLVAMYKNVTEQLGGKLAKFNMSDVKLAGAKGEIDLLMELEVSATETITILQYIENHNSDIDNSNSLELPKATERTLIDALTAVLKERQLAMTPSQRLLAAIATDVISRGAILMKIASDRKSMFEWAKEKHEERKKERFEAMEQELKTK